MQARILDEENGEKKRLKPDGLLVLNISCGSHFHTRKEL
jgi:hypothetical protein